MSSSVSNSFCRCSTCSVTSSRDYWADDASSLPSCSIAPFEDSNIKMYGKVEGQFGDVFQMNQDQEKPMPISSAPREGIAKQFNWTKYWKWPPVKLSDLDISSIASENSLTEPKGVCVRLDSSVPQKRHIPTSQTFVVNPGTVVFRQDPSSSRWDEFAWLRVQNKGNISRRLSLVPPVNHAFTIVWASTLNEKTTVAPGLYIRILIQFTPQTDHPIRDELLIRVEGDGGIVIPLMGIAQDPPHLEMEDFSCDCCLFGNKIKRTFRIVNRGGSGRFWLLSEAEFMNEYLGVVPSKTIEEPEIVEKIGEIEMEDEPEEPVAHEEKKYSEINVQVAEDDLETASCSNTPKTKRNTSEIGQLSTGDFHDPEIGDESLCEEENEDGHCDSMDVECSIMGEDEFEDLSEPPPPNSPAEFNTSSPGQLLIPPFRILPSCFSLHGGQEVKLRVSFQPPGPKFFQEKVALLCDNGEVRWFVLKGLGLEPKSQKVITVHAENWSLHESTTFNLGQMAPDEPFFENLIIRNSCSLPVYYFWTFRPVSADEVPPHDFIHPRTESDALGEEILQEESGEYKEYLESFLSELPLTISPAQGILRGCTDASCRLSFVCPDVLGQYGSQLSLSIQQLSQESLRAMSIMSEAELQQQINNSHIMTKHNAFSLHNYMNLPKFEIPPMPNESTFDLQILVQSEALQCWFEPRIIITSGFTFTQTKKKLKFFNFTKYEVNLKLFGFKSDVCNVRIYPENLKVSPHTVASFKVTRRFQKAGEFEGLLKGVLTLPYKSVEVFVPMKISSEEPPPCESNESESAEMKFESGEIGTGEIDVHGETGETKEK